MLDQKIHSIRCEMKGENGEFESKFKKIRLRVEIEVKIGEKKHDIWKRKLTKFYNFRAKKKFRQFEFKWQEKMSL